MGSGAEEIANKVIENIIMPFIHPILVKITDRMKELNGIYGEVKMKVVQLLISNLSLKFLLNSLYWIIISLFWYNRSGAKIFNILLKMLIFQVFLVLLKKVLDLIHCFWNILLIKPLNIFKLFIII